MWSRGWIKRRSLFASSSALSVGIPEPDDSVIDPTLSRSEMIQSTIALLFLAKPNDQVDHDSDIDDEGHQARRGKFTGQFIDLQGNQQPRGNDCQVIRPT